MPYISTKKNKKTFNLTSGVHSNFESDNYKIVKLYDLNKESIQALEVYSDIPGTILYNPWSTTFHLYTNGMDLRFREREPERPIMADYTNHVNDLISYSGILGSSGIPSYNFDYFSGTEIYTLFRKHYPEIIDSNWSRWNRRYKGLIGIDYFFGGFNKGYAMGDFPLLTQNCLDLSMDFVKACVNPILKSSSRKSHDNYRYLFFNVLNYVKKILVFEHMKTNRKFSDLLSILPEEGILHSSSKYLFQGLVPQDFTSALYSVIEDPNFSDQIEIINQSILSEFSFEDFSFRLAKRSHSNKMFASLDLSFAYKAETQESTSNTIAQCNEWITAVDWFNNPTYARSYNTESRNTSTLIKDMDPSPIIYWQPLRFDIITRFNDCRSMGVKFGFRDPRYDLPYLYLNSSAYAASSRKSCSVLMIPNQPTEPININQVCQYYS
jgi:hypothetical protein